MKEKNLKNHRIGESLGKTADEFSPLSVHTKVIIAMLSGKGGSGKTTNAKNYGMFSITNGKDVLFVDMDKHRNLSKRLGVMNKGSTSRMNIFLEYAVNEIPDESGYIDCTDAEIMTPFSLEGTPWYAKAMKYAKNRGVQCGRADIFVGQPDIENKVDTIIKTHGFEKFAETFASVMLRYKAKYDVIIFDLPVAGKDGNICRLAAFASDLFVCPINDGESASNAVEYIGYVDATVIPQRERMVFDNFRAHPRVVFLMNNWRKTSTCVGKKVDAAFGLTIFNDMLKYDINANVVHAILLYAAGSNTCKTGIPIRSDISSMLYGGFKSPNSDLLSRVYEELTSLLFVKSDVQDVFTPEGRKMINRLFNTLSKFEILSDDA